MCDTQEKECLEGGSYVIYSQLYRGLWSDLYCGTDLGPLLRKWKAGQSIREDGPTWHMSKQGTPTMGGLMFILGIGVAIVTAGWEEIQRGNFIYLFVYLFALVFGAIGFVDDFQSCAITPTRG